MWEFIWDIIYKAYVLGSRMMLVFILGDWFIVLYLSGIFLPPSPEVIYIRDGPDLYSLEKFPFIQCNLNVYMEKPSNHQGMQSNPH